jgi:hypothetical protein
MARPTWDLLAAEQILEITQMMWIRPEGLRWENPLSGFPWDNLMSRDSGPDPGTIAPSFTRCAYVAASTSP